MYTDLLIVFRKTFSIVIFKKITIYYTASKVSKYGVFSGPYYLHIQSECGKIRARKNFVFGQFSRSVTGELISVRSVDGKF